jgi:hypothetical protein
MDYLQLTTARRRKIEADVRLQWLAAKKIEADVRLQRLAAEKLKPM